PAPAPALAPPPARPAPMMTKPPTTTRMTTFPARSPSRSPPRGRATGRDPAPAVSTLNSYPYLSIGGAGTPGPGPISLACLRHRMRRRHVALHGSTADAMLAAATAGFAARIEPGDRVAGHVDHLRIAVDPEAAIGVVDADRHD